MKTITIIQEALNSGALGEMRSIISANPRDFIEPCIRFIVDEISKKTMSYDDAIEFLVPYLSQQAIAKKIVSKNAVAACYKLKGHTLMLGPDLESLSEVEADLTVKVGGFVEAYYSNFIRLKSVILSIADGDLDAIELLEKSFRFDERAEPIAILYGGVKNLPKAIDILAPIIKNDLIINLEDSQNGYATSKLIESIIKSIKKMEKINELTIKINSKKSAIPALRDLVQVMRTKSTAINLVVGFDSNIKGTALDELKAQLELDKVSSKHGYHLSYGPMVILVKSLRS